MTTQLQPAFRALADPTRRDILHLLSSRDMTIGEIAGQFTMTRAAVKKHLTALEQGNLIKSHVNGRQRINRLNPSGLRPILDWLSFFDQFWDDRLSALQTTIEKDSADD